MYEKLKKTLRSIVPSTLVWIIDLYRQDRALNNPRYFFYPQRKSKITDPEVRKALSQIDEVGFFVKENFLSLEECEKLRNAIDEAAANNPKYVIEYPTEKRLHCIDQLSEVFGKFKEMDYINAVTTNYFDFNGIWVMGNHMKYNANGKFGSGGGWHRDGFAREIKAIIYLNDTNENNGAFQILKYSHKLKQKALDGIKLKLGSDVNRLDALDNELESGFKDRIHTVSGKAGSLIMFDTSSIHRGLPLKEGERYAITNYYFHKHFAKNKDDIDHLVSHYANVLPQKVLPNQDKLKEELYKQAA